MSTFAFLTLPPASHFFVGLLIAGFTVIVIAAAASATLIFTRKFVYNWTDKNRSAWRQARDAVKGCRAAQMRLAEACVEHHEAAKQCQSLLDDIDACRASSGTASVPALRTAALDGDEQTQSSEAPESDDAQSSWQEKPTTNDSGKAESKGDGDAQERSTPAPQPRHRRRHVLIAIALLVVLSVPAWIFDNPGVLLVGVVLLAFAPKIAIVCRAGKSALELSRDTQCLEHVVPIAASHKDRVDQQLSAVDALVAELKGLRHKLEGDAAQLGDEELTAYRKQVDAASVKLHGLLFDERGHFDFDLAARGPGPYMYFMALSEQLEKAFNESRSRRRSDSEPDSSWQETDYYGVLGVARDASEDEIKAAYRRLAMIFHPDLNHGDTEAERKFKEINEAHRVLKDPQKRAAYDHYGKV